MANKYAHHPTILRKTMTQNTNDTALSYALVNSNLSMEDRAAALGAVVERARLRKALNGLREEFAGEKKAEPVSDVGLKNLQIAMDQYGANTWVAISDGDRFRAPGNFAAAVRQLLAERSLPPHVIDTFISSALKELGEQPLIVLPENRIGLMKVIMRKLIELKKGK